MKTLARKYFELNEYDNTALDVANLERAAKQRDQNWEAEKTAYIFSDGSAIVASSNNNYEIVNNYDLSADNEQLNGFFQGQ
jgi:hypothetical protein